jgi:hypothetical protein
MLLMFALVEYDMLSGGALGSLALGATAAACWRNGRPRAGALTLGPAPGFADELDAAVAVLWDWCDLFFLFWGCGRLFWWRPCGTGARCFFSAFYVCFESGFGQWLVWPELAFKQNIRHHRTTPRTSQTSLATTQTIYITISPNKLKRLGEPMIFGTIGASIDFATLPASVAARALAIVCIGARFLFAVLIALACICTPVNTWQNQTKTHNTKTGLLVRALSTFATMWGRIGGCACVDGGGGAAARPKACARCCAGSGGGGGGAGCGPSYTWREALFFAVAWTPKATVQAALSGAPLHVVRL